MSRKHQCTVPECTEAVKYLESGLCGACYAALYYWRDATPTELVRHQRKLRRSESRMEMKLGNVKALKRRTGR